MNRRIDALVFACLAMAACSNPFGPDSRREIGLIQPPSDREPVILAPDIVRVGVRFTVTVNSFGSSSCTIPDGVDLDLSESLAVVTPYDRGPAGDAVCTADIAPRPHPVQLNFSATGVATIRAFGYRIEDGRRVLASVDRSVIVQP